ncbi:MAG: hypothetical protein Q4G52_10345 [Clostridia bacterium]|nr:hypothetical protein [Clostridia bacterium]
MKKKLVRLLKTFLFCALLFGILASISKVVERKASTIRFKPFLDHAEDFDVLFIGDSHSVNGIFPMDLWQDYGIAAYNIASYGNTLPVSYWAMMNALDYASPKLMVIGIKDVHRYNKVSGSSGDVHTALDCYPLSLTKIRTIEDLMNTPYAIDDEGNYYVDMKWEYYFTLGKYHSRWSEINDSDFHYRLNSQKGGEMAIGVADPNDYDIIDENWALEEGGAGFQYLRMMIEECQSRGIDVLLIHLPYPSTEEDQMAANAVQYIAEEYGVNYVDFVSLDQVVDYEVDCYDSFSHLNPSGARKVTDFLGRYIADHYDIPDRRGDERYRHWASDVDVYTELKLAYLRSQDDLRNLLMLLHDSRFSACIAIRKNSPVYNDSKVMRLLQNIAREHIYEEDAFAKWSNTLFPLSKLEDAAARRDAYFLLIDRKNGAVEECAGNDISAEFDSSFGHLAYSAEGGDAALSIERDGAPVPYGDMDAAEIQPDIRVLVIDDRTSEVAAVKQFPLISAVSP